MEQLYIITNSGYYLKSEKDFYLDALAHKTNDVLELCWTKERDEAMKYNEQQVQEIVHGVESILMVPDETMKWEAV